MIWGWIAELDQIIEKDQPWKLDSEKLGKVLEGYVKKIGCIAVALQPFLPETAKKILKQFERPKIKSAAPLFPRIK